MTGFELKFKQKLEETIPFVKDIICYNFSEKGEKYYSGDDNGFFIMHTDRKLSLIKIKFNIDSNNSDLRMKMYYAKQPGDAFNEEQTKELGYLCGEDYEEIIDLQGEYDSFRFDFGFAPIEFDFSCFVVAELSENERKEYYDLNKKRNIIQRGIRYFKKNGLKAGLIQTKRVLLEKGIKNSSEIEQKVPEPYKVQIKQPLENERKKVLHIIENFHTGGSSRLIIDIIEYYGHKFDHKIFTMAYRGEEEFIGVDAEGIDVEKPEIVLKGIEEYNPDIIHVHIWKGDWYHKVFNILDNIGSRRIIIENINTPIAPIERDYIKKYIFVSNYVVKEFYPQADDRTQVVYPGSNFEMFTRELNGDYLAKDTIGMVYRLGYDKLNRKSIDVFIKTVQKRPSTKVIIVGGGPRYNEYVERVQKAGVMDNFEFTGYVPYVTLPEWYKKLTIFVAPVWQESFGQVSPFAMNMGIPVAGYDIGALNEIIQNEKLLAKPDDSDELSDIIVDLLENYEKCKQIGVFNKNRAQAEFGVRKMVDDYFDIYQSLV